MESPNFDKIAVEAGDFTAEAVNSLYLSINELRRSIQFLNIATDVLTPRVITLSPSASVDNLDLSGCSVVSFVGSSAQNFTGIQAPETGISQIVIVHVSGSGTITVKHELTSEAQNQISTSSGSDVTLSTGNGIILAYLASKWREVA